MQSTNQTILYGIPNCSTVQKARDWLREQNIDFVFHDFKKNGLERSTVEAWLEHIDLELLINRKGTTWRALSAEQKAGAELREGAVALVLASPSLIKRPLLQLASGVKKNVSVGFSAQQYQAIFPN